MDDGRRYSEDRFRVSRINRRTSAEDTRKPTRRVEEREGNRHHCVRSSSEPKEHTQQQGRNDEKKRKSIANRRQEKSIANSRQKKSIANSRQKKNKNTCEKPKAEREEHMEHTEDLHIQYKVNEEYTKNTLKTENRRNRASPWRTRSSKWRLKRKRLRRHRKDWSAIEGDWRCPRGTESA